MVLVTNCSSCWCFVLVSVFYSIAFAQQSKLSSYIVVPNDFCFLITLPNELNMAIWSYILA